jgi:hypothetical protein
MTPKQDACAVGNLNMQTNVPCVSLFSCSSRSERDLVPSKGTVSKGGFRNLEETERG